MQCNKLTVFFFPAKWLINSPGTKCVKYWYQETFSLLTWPEEDSNMKHSLHRYSFFDVTCFWTRYSFFDFTCFWTKINFVAECYNIHIEVHGNTVDLKLSFRKVHQLQMNGQYSWTFPQWPPWGQKKVALVERWQLVKIRLYICH